MTLSLVVFTSCFILKSCPCVSCLAPFSSSSVSFSLLPAISCSFPHLSCSRLTPPVPRPLISVSVYVVSVLPHRVSCSVFSVFDPWSSVSLPCLSQLCLLVSHPGMFLVFAPLVFHWLVLCLCCTLFEAFLCYFLCCPLWLVFDFSWSFFIALISTSHFW